jgi:glucose-6-phosphate isomerase
MTDETNKSITYDPSGLFIEGTGLGQQDLANLSPRLETARREVLDDLELLRAGGAVPPDKEPLDAAFIDLPERLLVEYRQDRSGSELGRILAAAERLKAMVDRVIVIGIGGSYMGTRSLFEACCHPYHNELTRDERHGHPRIYFAGRNVDNDATQGLLDTLGNGRETTTTEERWGIIVVSKSGGTLEPAIALRQFLAALQSSNGKHPELIPQLVLPVTSRNSNLFNLASALGCESIFEMPDSVGGRFSILTAVGLLPAAVLGIDIVRLLEGAAAMTQSFRDAGAGENNAVLSYVAACHLMEEQHGANIRVLSVWKDGLEACGLWYDQLLSESLGKEERGATPLTAVNTRDLHSRGQQHQQGRRDKLITNVVVDAPRRAPLPVGHSRLNQDGLNELADKTLPDIMAAAIKGTKLAYSEDRRPTADIHLPAMDEHALGQFYQMMMLATCVEGRLIGINPYGQPGVEAYKKHMKLILQGAE